jgi:hypothetical protein
VNDRNFAVGEWAYDDERKSLLNTRHGTWELELHRLETAHDLLSFTLQAGQKYFNMTEFLQALGRAAQLHFDTGEINPVIALKVLYDIDQFTPGPRRRIEWPRGVIKDDL